MGNLKVDRKETDIMKFQIDTNPFDDKKPLYRRKNIEFKVGVTVLVGCNGSGKTTLLRQLARKLDNKDLLYVKYNNLTDGGSNARSKAIHYGNMEFLAASMCSSEGENIAMNLGNVARQIRQLSNTCHKHNLKQLFVLIDGIDSGMSIDTIEDVKKYLFIPVLEDNDDLEVYIIVSANDYTMAKDEQCFDVYTGNYRTFKDYDDYRNFIIKSKERKDKRYGYEGGDKDGRK